MSLRTFFLGVVLLSFAGITHADLSDGLVAYYPLDGNANDFSGSGNHGTEYNGVSYAPGVSGQAASFDGIDDFIEARSDGLPTGERTVSLWFYADTIRIPRPVLLGYGGGNSCGTSWYMTLAPAPEPFFYLSGHCHSFDLYGPHPEPPTGAWYHWAITTNTDGTKFFVNGQEVASHSLFVNNTSVIPGRDLTIGVDVWYHGFGPYTDINVGWFDGMIDEVRIYDRALSAEEISFLTGFRITSSPKLSVQLEVFSSHQFQAEGGLGPFSWSVIDGTPPPGMSFDSDGTLSGIPTQTGEFTFTASVTDSDSRTAEQSFTVEVVLIPPPPSIRVFKTGSIPVPGRTSDYFIVVENIGTETARDIEVGEMLDPKQASLLSVNPQGVVEDSVFADISFILWLIPQLDPGELSVLQYQVTISPTVPLGTTVTGAACTGTALADGLESCLGELSKTVAGCAVCAGVCSIGSSCGFLCTVPTLPTLAGCVGCLTPCAICMLCGDPLSGCGGGCVQDTQSVLGCFTDLYDECSTHEAPAEGALDPNEKLVIAEKYIQPDQLLIYPIHFENIGTIEARDIFITDVLDTNLDLSTLEVLTADVTTFMDPATRTLKVELLNRDLLPGETDNVLLSVKPLPGLPSGTEIRNDATIQFEVFDPFTTNEVVNIIDTTRPVCVMDALPAEATTLDFPIAWSGTDEVGEIDYYTVLVSEDGGDFTPFVERTAEISAIFTGEPEKTYGFICVAVDTAGNIEIQDAVAEATTTVVVAAPSDLDGDGVPDGEDNCPAVANADQVDSDGDDIGDACDNCPNDPAKVDPGICGCGVADADGDGDGMADCNDQCPADPAKTEPGVCGCGVADTDSDGDGTADCNDACPLDPDNDADGDGVCGDMDNCPVTANPGQEDGDGDGVGDACDNQLPDCSGAEPSIGLLWPANHDFVPVDILGVTDPDGDTVTITIDSIFQDEAVDAKGSGNTAPDGSGVGTATAEVRAERSGRGNGRVYHIGFTADDGNGGICSGEVTVGVPKNQGNGSVPVDDGALYDSTIMP